MPGQYQARVGQSVSIPDHYFPDSWGQTTHELAFWLITRRISKMPSGRMRSASLLACNLSFHPIAVLLVIMVLQAARKHRSGLSWLHLIFFNFEGLGMILLLFLYNFQLFF